MTLLQLQDLTYRYKNTAEAVLYKINYDFEPGKFYSIIGESYIFLLIISCLSVALCFLFLFRKSPKEILSSIS